MAKVNELDFREEINCVESDEKCSARPLLCLWAPYRESSHSLPECVLLQNVNCTVCNQ